MLKRLFLAVLFLCIFSGFLMAETTEAVPEPYTAQEFPHWVKSLRRVEIVSLGSYPVSFLATYLGFGFYRYFTSGEDGGELNTAYLPKPFNFTGTTVDYTQDETKGVILASAGISLVIALVDLIIEESRIEEEEAIIVIDYRTGLNPPNKEPLDDN